MPWTCFMITPTRPCSDYTVWCPTDHRTVVEVLEDVGFNDMPDAPTGGWPTRCAECGVAMDYEADGLTYSRSGWSMWRNEEGTEHRHQHEFGPGAMYVATWLGEGDYVGPDGRSLGVVLPPGGVGDHWLIDGPAGNGGHWVRTGEAPVLTVTPSILSPNYHGFLRGGVLTDSLSDRPLP